MISSINIYVLSSLFHRIGEASSDPKTIGPADTVREKAAETTDENQDTEPA
jgi:hypothetical protein